MKHWIRLPHVRHCGGCCKNIAEGAPALVITDELNHTKRLRCVACAKHPHGEEPPAVIETAPIVTPVRFHFSHHRPDPKQRQTGERD